jgi:predicted dehydrogenase
MSSSKAAVSRRTFLGATAASYARVSGANDRVRCGTIGTGGRGWYLTGCFKEFGAEVAAVCDVYEPRLAAGLKQASTGAKSYVDYRRLLEDKSLDAVIIATPDFWHSKMAVDAVEAGKDIYLEKPMARTIEDGARIVEAVRRTRRVAQVGTQRRSYGLYHEAKQIYGSGEIGDVRLVNSWWVNHQRALQAPVLKGKLDWDLFLGPVAPKIPLDASRYFNWLYFRDYAGGMLAGQGAHILDGIHMMTGSTYPVAVTAAGGRPNIPGAELTETASMSVEYPENYLLVFTIGYKAMRYNMFNDQMQQFHGDKARFDLGRESYAVWPQSSAIDMKASRERRDPGSFEAASGAHVRNFLECLRSRKEPNATVEMGQSAVIVLGMAMESLMSGRRMKWDNQARRMAG